MAHKHHTSSMIPTYPRQPQGPHIFEKPPGAVPCSPGSWQRTDPGRGVDKVNESSLHLRNVHDECTYERGASILKAPSILIISGLCKSERDAFKDIARYVSDGPLDHSLSVSLGLRGLLRIRFCRVELKSRVLVLDR